MRELIITAPAKQDLRDIWNYIADDDVAAANRVADAIDARIRRIHASPGAGHSHRGISDKRYLAFSVYAYVIIYRYDERSVTIIRVLHGKRDFSKLFPPP